MYQTDNGWVVHPDDTCKWAESKSETCNSPASAVVLVTGRDRSVVPAPVPLCTKHKSVHDQTFAQLRATQAALRGGKR